MYESPTAEILHSYISFQKKMEILPLLLQADANELKEFDLGERDLWRDGNQCNVPECTTKTSFGSYKVYIKHYKTTT